MIKMAIFPVVVVDMILLLLLSAYTLHHYHPWWSSWTESNEDAEYVKEWTNKKPMAKMIYSFLFWWLEKSIFLDDDDDLDDDDGILFSKQKIDRC